MKKNLLILLVGLTGFASHLFAQCVPTCSSYVAAPITFSTFPTGPTNITPSFTNSFLGATSDDGSLGPIPIGFSFDFYCSSYTNVHICSNGFIMLDYQAFPWPTQYVHPTQSLPNSALPDGMIAFNMTDLDPGQGGSVTYTTVGIAPNRMFIVTYSNVPCFSTPSDLNTGQIVLYESSNIIEIHTKSAHPDINQGSSGSTQGIENTSGTAATTPPGRNANNSWGATADSTAYRFMPFTPTPPTAITGNTMLCQGTFDFYQATFMTGSTTYSWALPNGWTGTSTLTSITPTAGASGNLSVVAIYTCGPSAPTTLSVTVNPAPIVAINSVTPNVICSGKTVTLTLSGGVNYTVNPGFITGQSPLTDQPNMNITYTVVGEDALGCTSNNNPTSFVLVKPTPSIAVNSGSICLGATFTLSPSGANNYTFSNLFSSVTPTLPGNYTYTVTGTYGGSNNCVGDPVTSSLTVFALPTVTAAASRTSICAKEIVTVTAGGASTYTWSNQQTNSSFTAALNATTVYVVTGTDANGCKDSHTVNVTVKPCTGIEEQAVGNFGLEVFPNPNNGLLTFRSQVYGNGVALSVYNAIGQLVFEDKVRTPVTELNLQHLNNGLYYIKITENQRHQVVRIIKE